MNRPANPNPFSQASAVPSSPQPRARPGTASALSPGGSVLDRVKAGVTSMGAKSAREDKSARDGQ